MKTAKNVLRITTWRGEDMREWSPETEYQDFAFERVELRPLSNPFERWVFICKDQEVEIQPRQNISLGDPDIEKPDRFFPLRILPGPWVPRDQSVLGSLDPCLIAELVGGGKAVVYLPEFFPTNPAAKPGGSKKNRKPSSEIKQKELVKLWCACRSELGRPPRVRDFLTEYKSELQPAGAAGRPAAPVVSGGSLIAVHADSIPVMSGFDKWRHRQSVFYVGQHDPMSGQRQSDRDERSVSNLRW